MVVHIVMFEFKDENREENIEKVSSMLNSLIDSVPTLRQIEVGKNFNDTQRAMDLSIITIFDDKDGLSRYATHPEHLRVVEFIREVTTQTRVVDYIR
jgi:hypothetical protein